MFLRKISLLSFYENLAGFSLGFILLTNYRFLGGKIGFGELGLLICTIIGFFIFLKNKGLPISSFSDRYFLTVFLYFFSILLSVTLINILTDTKGAAFYDWIAYFFSATFLLSIKIIKPNIERITKLFIFTVLILCLYHYLYQTEYSWYATRFTGGAKNPNQLALYIICSITAVFLYPYKFLYKTILLSALTFFGFLSLSDAFSLSFFCIFFALTLVRLRHNIFFYFLIFLAFLYNHEYIISYLSELWLSSDEGNGRLLLYKNAINSWTTNIFTIFLGNGTGAFSGIHNPYEGAESHNTFIEVLSVGGVSFFIVFYIPLLYCLYLNRNKIFFGPLLGLIIFSLFHYVARHPIWWFIIYLLYVKTDMLLNRSPTENLKNYSQQKATSCAV